MEINIWSDIRCPFCYIGKRKFEAGLQQFKQKDKVKINWRSFELDPDLQTQTDVNVYDYFTERKGIPRDQAEKLHNQVAQTADEVGLAFNFDKAVVANSFNAHRLIKLADSKGLGDKAQEALFESYFTEGKNIDDNETLVKIGTSIGLTESEIRKVLFSDAFSEKVRQDEDEAQSIGIKGVPFFVFNNKYGVSGAQSPAAFLQVLEQSWEEFEKANPLVVVEGESCSVDGTCN